MDSFDDLQSIRLTDLNFDGLLFSSTAPVTKIHAKNKGLENIRKKRYV